MLLATTGREAVGNGVAHLSQHSCRTALPLLVQVLLLDVTFLLHWRKKNRLYTKFGIVEVSAGSRWNSRWSSDASNYRNPAAVENNYSSLAVCAYLSFGGCQPLQPQLFTVQCTSLNLWNSWYSSWWDCALLHLVRPSQNCCAGCPLIPAWI